MNIRTISSNHEKWCGLYSDHFLAKRSQPIRKKGDYIHNMHIWHVVIWLVGLSVMNFSILVSFGSWVHPQPSLFFLHKTLIIINGEKKNVFVLRLLCGYTTGIGERERERDLERTKIGMVECLPFVYSRKPFREITRGSSHTIYFLLCKKKSRSTLTAN